MQLSRYPLHVALLPFIFSRNFYKNSTAKKARAPASFVLDKVPRIYFLPLASPSPQPLSHKGRGAKKGSTSIFVEAFPIFVKAPIGCSKHQAFFAPLSRCGTSEAQNNRRLARRISESVFCSPLPLWDKRSAEQPQAGSKGKRISFLLPSWDKRRGAKKGSSRIRCGQRHSEPGNQASRCLIRSTILVVLTSSMKSNTRTSPP